MSRENAVGLTGVDVLHIQSVLSLSLSQSESVSDSQTL